MQLRFRVAEPPVSGVGGGGSGYGAYFGSIPDFTEIPNGVRFADVKDGSPAGKAGLKAGDIMTEFDGQPVESPEDLLELLSGDRVGREVKVGVLRGGETRELSVTVGERQA